MAAYGDFVGNFPELIVTLRFTKGILIPAIYDSITSGSEHRQKVARSTSVMSVKEIGQIYVSDLYQNDIYVGDVFENPYFGYEMKIVGRVPYTQSAGYNVYDVQRVEGHSSSQQGELPIKQAEF